mmetsp:Transcript_57896/g.130849  ORF Transcript_57896/g.130849 Transcript_57896/m.130849 type:complete len:379 (-) Transcript_57896:109-1245(-)
MKAVRERMRKSLTITAPAKPGAKTASSQSNLLEGHKEFRCMTEAQFAKLYKLKGQVMESTNTGMEVVFATRLSDNLEVVIKVRDRSKSFKRGADEREWRATTEVQLNMPKIETMCHFIDVFETKENYYVVMEKVEGRDLFEQMASERLRINDAREILFQILTAVKAMHDAGRIHKDLKLENVMVDMDSSPRKVPPSPGSCTSSMASPGVKLIDFDTVQDWEPSSPKARDVLGTDGYIAPEAYGGEYSPSSDIYCIGVIMYKLLTRKFPSRADIFDDQPGENWVGSPAMKRIQERLKNEKIDFSRPPLNRCPAAADLVSKMLAYDPNVRYSADDALRHEWFALKPEDLSPTLEGSRTRGGSGSTMAGSTSSLPGTTPGR